VNLAEVLDQHVALIKRHIYTSDESAQAAALWTCATHAIDYLDSIGYLRITSPDKKCGKTNFARLLKKSTRKPLYVSSVTPAFLFRTIEADLPTLILDECDNILKDNRELLCMLNAGINREEAWIGRCVGDDHVRRIFSVFCPKLICGIGSIASTLASRCITILLHRKPKDIDLKPLAEGIDEAEEIGRKYCRWITDNIENLDFKTRPSMPRVLDDRQRDCWCALFILADAAGGHWPQTARQAAIVLAGCSDEEDNINVRLLLDIANTFKDRADVSATEIVAYLNNDPNMDWGRYGRHGLSPVIVGRKLKQLGLNPCHTKIGNVYQMSDILALAAHYTRDSAENDGGGEG
jgi:hypothetical protein